MFSAVPMYLLYQHHVIPCPAHVGCPLAAQCPALAGVVWRLQRPCQYGSPALAWPQHCTGQPAQEKPGRQEAPRWPAQRSIWLVISAAAAAAAAQQLNMQCYVSGGGQQQEL